MTQDSNPSPQMQWGRQPALPPQPAWWLGVLTVPSLLGHIVVMLGVCSALTVVNLLAGPRLWWSLAILVIWLALVIIHAIGVGSRSLLFADDDAEAPAQSVRRPRAEPIGPAVPTWLNLPRRNSTPETPVPESWKLPDDTPDPDWDASPAQNGEPAPAPEPKPEKVPWRAATDIAWLRRPRPAGSDEEPPPSKTASS